METEKSTLYLKLTVGQAAQIYGLLSGNGGMRETRRQLLNLLGGGLDTDTRDPVVNDRGGPFVDRVDQECAPEGKITHEMLEAGVKAFLDFRDATSASDAIKAIYRAMRAAKDDASGKPAAATGHGLSGGTLASGGGGTTGASKPATAPFRGGIDRAVPKPGKLEFEGEQLHPDDDHGLKIEGRLKFDRLPNISLNRTVKRFAEILATLAHDFNTLEVVKVPKTDAILLRATKQIAGQTVEQSGTLGRGDPNQISRETIMRVVNYLEHRFAMIEGEQLSEPESDEIPLDDGEAIWRKMKAEEAAKEAEKRIESYEGVVMRQAPFGRFEVGPGRFELLKDGKPMFRAGLVEDGTVGRYAATIPHQTAFDIIMGLRLVETMRQIGTVSKTRP